MSSASRYNLSWPHDRYGLTVHIEVTPPHPWYRLVYEAAAKARIRNDEAIEVVVAILGVVHVLTVREIDLRGARSGDTMHLTCKPQGDPFPVPIATPKAIGRAGIVVEDKKP